MEKNHNSIQSYGFQGDTPLPYIKKEGGGWILLDKERFLRTVMQVDGRPTHSVVDPIFRPYVKCQKLSSEDLKGFLKNLQKEADYTTCIKQEPMDDYEDQAEEEKESEENYEDGGQVVLVKEELDLGFYDRAEEAYCNAESSVSVDSADIDWVIEDSQCASGSPFDPPQVRRMEPRKKIACPLCAYTTLKKSEFATHLKEAHGFGEVNPQQEEAKIDIVKGKSSNGEKIFNCTICDYTTAWKFNVSRHIMRVHGLNPDKWSDKKVSKKSTRVKTKSLPVLENEEAMPKKVRMSEGGEMGFRCAICGYETRWKSWYDRHAKRHLRKDVESVIVAPVPVPEVPKASELDFQCNHCNYRTKYKVTFKRHMEKHGKAPSDGWPFKCQLCGYGSKSEVTVKRHMKQHTFTEPTVKPPKTYLPYKCLHCRYETKWRTSYLRHCKRHEERDRTCEICGVKVSSKDDLESHRECHEVEEVYYCERCNYTTKWKMNLDRHTKRLHGIHDVGSAVWDVPGNSTVSRDPGQGWRVNLEPAPPPTDDSRFHCTSCDFVTKWEPVLKRHVRAVHSSEQSFDCPYCDFKGSSQSAEEDHIKMNHTTPSGMLLKCSMCDYTVNNANLSGRATLNLQLHFHSCHTVQCDRGTRYKCQLCRYGTNWRINYSRHSSRCHRKVAAVKSEIEVRQQPLECDLCDFKTSTKLNLQQHIDLHHPEEYADFSKKRFWCDLCDFRTRWKVNMRRHSARFHGSQAIKCDICRYTTLSKTDMENHIKTHVMFHPCDLCDLRLASRESLRDHRATDHGEP